MKISVDFGYTYTRTNLKLKLNSSFAIPSELISELEEYRLVYWNASHLYKRLMLNLEEKTNYDYYIDKQDILYHVTMINCSIDQIYDIALNEPDRQIRISFRRARKHWNLPAYAIIKLPAPRKGLPVIQFEQKEQRNYNHDKA